MTTYFMSTSDFDTLSKDPQHAGTSSTATDLIELRAGTAGANVTHRQILNALQIFERWVIQKGLDGAGANLPPSAG